MSFLDLVVKAAVATAIVGAKTEQVVGKGMYVTGMAIAKAGTYVEGVGLDHEHSLLVYQVSRIEKKLEVLGGKEEVVKAEAAAVA